MAKLIFKSGPRVVVLSPYAGDVEANVAYAIECVRDCLKRGEEPYAVHLMMPQCLDDSVPEQRRRGMEVGWSWMLGADLVVAYVDRGVSTGMMQDLTQASTLQKQIEFRELPPPFELRPGHLRALRLVRDAEEGKFFFMNDGNAVIWTELIREGYVFTRDRLAQAAELTAKGRAAVAQGERLVRDG